MGMAGEGEWGKGEAGGSPCFVSEGTTERVKGPAGGRADGLGLELRIPRPGEPLAADHVSCPEGRPPYPRSWVDHASSIQTHGHRRWSLHDSWKDSRGWAHLKTTHPSGNHCSHEPASA